MERPIPEPTATTVEEARRNPGGWVLVREPGYERWGAIPTEAIIGAWRVDEEGRLTRDFIWNPMRGRSGG